MTGSRPAAGDTMALRSALAGLLSLAAAEEQTLLAETAFRADGDPGRADNWAAVPLVAHNNEFKGQQAERLVALAAGQVPATYGETDHSSAEVYRGYRAQPAAAVRTECRPARHGPAGRPAGRGGLRRAGQGAFPAGGHAGRGGAVASREVAPVRRKDFRVSCHRLQPR